MLKNVEVFTDSQLFRRYELTHAYDFQLGYERVTKVQEINNDEEGANPVLFTYEMTSTTNNNTEVKTNYDEFLKPSFGINGGDFDGDGNLDLMNNGKIFTKMFQGGSAVSAPNPSQGLPITTLSNNNKVNQFQSVLSVADVQQQSVTFNIKNLDAATNSMVQVYSKTVDFPSYGSCFSNCPNFTCDSTFYTSSSNRYFEGDFNGDGISELLLLYFPEHRQYENVPAPLTGNSSNTSARLPDPMQDCKYTFTISNTPNAIRLLDLNPNSSTVLGAKGYVDLSFPSVNIYGKLSVGDFNGDGKSDLLAVREDKTYTVIGFKQLNAAPWVEFEKIGEGTLTDYEKDKIMLFGDFNGDLKTDVIIPVAKKNSNWAIYFSNPKLNAGEMFEKETHTITEYYPDTGTPGTPGAEYTTFETFKNYYVIDANKDGKSDLVMFKVDYTKKEWWQYKNFDTKWKVYSFANNIGNTMTSTTFSPDYESASEHSSGDPGIPLGLASNFRFKGINRDFVVLRGDFDGNPGYAVYTKFTKDVSDDYLLKSVSQSDGAIVNTMEYKNLMPANGEYGALSDFYSSTNSLSYPYVEIKQPSRIKLVERVTNVTMGVTKKQEFKYHGLVMNLNGLGMIGFMKTARSAWFTNSSAKKIWSVTEIDPLFRGSIIRSYSQLTNSSFAFLTSYTSGLISKVEYQYTQSTDPVSKRYVGLLDKETTTDNISGTVSEKATQYSQDYYLPTKVTIKNYQGAVLQGTYVSDVTYDLPSLGANYIIGRPIEKKNTALNVYNDTKFNVEKYTYVNNRISKTEKNVSKDPSTLDDVTLIEELEYFPNGNIKKKIIRASGTSAANALTPRSTQYTYDITNRFVKTITDPELLVTTYDEYDPIYGVVLKETNHLGQSTTSLYDTWGKRYRVSNFLNKGINYTYTKTGNLYTTTETGDDNSVATAESDVLGKVVRKGTKDINGAWSYVKTEYDDYGRKLRESEPYASSPTLWTTYEYDDYSRIVKTISSTGRQSTITITGLSVESFDEVMKKTVVKNANGHVVSSADAPGGAITYKYDAMGNLLESNYDGVVLKMKYDNWGRKIELEDPSAGIYKYSYNAFGEILTDETPKGTTTFTLNAVGKPSSKRIVGKTVNEKTDILSTYSYDPTYKWVTRIDVTNAYDGNGIYEYFYDPVTKQLNKTVETTPQAKFTKELGFDGFGRVDAETSTANVFSPNKTSTVKTKNVYQNGALWKILDFDTNQLLWKVNSVNARGQLTGASLGNGIDIVNTFDSFGLPTQMKHDKTGTTPVNIMTLNNTFDVKRANLTQRYNSLFDLTEKFEYDTLDRLVTWNGGNQNLLTLPFNTTTDGFTFTGTGTSGSVTNLAGTLKVVLKNEFVEAKRALPTGFVANDIVNVKATITNKTGSGGVIVNAWIVETDPANAANWMEYYVGTIENGSFDKNYTVNNYVSQNPLLTIKFRVDENSPMDSNGGGMVAPNSTFYVDNFKIEKASVLTQQYDDRGRITKNELGDYSYMTAEGKPYRQKTLLPANTDVLNYYTAKGNLNIAYNAFKSPIEIEEVNSERISFGYNALQQRSVMYYGSTNTNKLLRPYHKYYSGDGTMEVKYTLSGNLLEFVTYVGGDAYTAPIVIKSDGTTKNNFYLHRDYLGSILAVTNNSGVLIEKRHFDAWGAVTKVMDGSGNNLTKLTFLDRGYTGHEHLQGVGLIHMNGRLYDPKLHRFLQPDNYVQDPYNTQNYNRYGYVLNNPLKHTDPSGEEFFTATFIVAVSAAVITHLLSSIAVEAPITFNSVVENFVFAAVASGMSAGIGSGVSTITPLLLKATVQVAAHGVFSGFMSEAQGGKFCTGFYSGAIASLASTLWGQFAGTFAYSAVGTMAFGTIAGGVGAKLSGGNFWQGAVTGLIVSGLNHVFHSMMERKALIERMKKGNIDPSGKPDFSQAGVDKMNNGVEGLKEEYIAAGRPKVSFDSTDEKEGGHTDYGHVHLNPSNITSNYRYASVLFHEYRHAWQWIYKHYGWSTKYRPNTVYNLMERDAYGHTIQIGIYSPYDLHDSVIKDNFDLFYGLTKHIKHF